MKTINYYWGCFIFFFLLSAIYAQTAPVPTKSREFSIPFEVRADSSADPVKEVELLYSQDRGVHWHSADRQSLEVGKFAYKADSDGEYWFAFRTVTLAGVTKQAGAASQIRVLVDSTPPKLSFTVTQQDSGALLVVWTAEDRNFQVKRPDFAVSVPSDSDKAASDQEKHWQPMNIDSRNFRSTESGLEGSFIFFPENGVSQIELRAAISDIAGNRTEKMSSVTIKPVHRETELSPDAPVASATIPVINSANLMNSSSDSEKPQQNVVETMTYPNGSVPLTPPKPVRMHQQPKNPPLKIETPNKPADQKSNQKLEQKTGREPAREPAQKSETLTEQQPIPILVSPDGKIAAVSNLSEPTLTLVENKLAEELLANMEGFFTGGLQVAASPIVKKPITKPTAEPPVPAKPSVAGSITGMTLSTSGKQPQIVVKWNVGDAPWSEAQIDVFRGVAASGPWQPIAINLRNSGEYWWFLTPDDFKPFYIMVRIRSLPGGVNSDVTQSPIKIDPKSLNKQL